MEWLTREASVACSGNNPTCQMHCLYSMLQPFLFLSFFFATLRKLTWSRLPSATVYHRRSVWLRGLPPFCASPSIWNFGCLSCLFRDNVSTETHPIHHHDVEFGAKTTVFGASCCLEADDGETAGQWKRKPWCFSLAPKRVNPRG